MKNRYEIKNDYVIVYTKQHQFLIDLEDLEKVSQFSWYTKFSKTCNNWYVAATYHRFKGDRNAITILLHRFLMNAQKGEYVDHNDFDTLNNRRYNLSVMSNDKNLIHRKSRNKNNISGERNVAFVKKTREWIVQFQVNGKNTCFGRFKYEDLEEAKKLARKLRKELYNED